MARRPDTTDTMSTAPKRSRLRLGDVLRVGTVGLGARKARTILTALGIAIGIAAMVTISGITASSKAQVQAEIEQFGTNFLVVTPGAGITEDAELLATAVPMIRRIGPVRSAAATYPVDATVRRTEFIPSVQTGGITVHAVDLELLEPLEAELAEGRWHDATTAALPTVVLGNRTARQLAIDSISDRPTVHISGTDFLVIGILEPVVRAIELERTALIGKSVAETLFADDDLIPASIYVRTVPDRLDAVRDIIPFQANPVAPNEVSVSRPTEALEISAAVDDSLANLLLALGLVALLVGAVGIANVMVIAVLERRGEIGVRRAIGATRKHIAMQFVVESALLSLIGGIMGVALGAALTVGYATREGWAVDVPLQWLAAGVGIALLVGALAGLYPAVRASRLDPAEAVRPAS